MALDRKTSAVDDQGEADQGTVAALLLGLAALGQVVAQSQSLEIGIGEIVEDDQGLGRRNRMGLLHRPDQSRLEGVPDLPQAVGDLIDGIFTHRPDVMAHDLPDCGLPRDPAVSVKLASRRDESADHCGFRQSPLLESEAGGDQNLVDAEAVPGLVAHDLGPQGPDLSGFQGVDGDDGRPGRSGRSPRVGMGPVFWLVGLQHRVDDRLDLGIKGEKWLSPHQPVFESPGQGLERRLGQGQLAQVEKDAVPGSALGLKGLDQPVGDVSFSGLIIFRFRFADEHRGEGSKFGEGDLRSVRVRRAKLSQ